MAIIEKVGKNTTTKTNNTLAGEPSQPQAQPQPQQQSQPQDTVPTQPEQNKEAVEQ